MDDFHSKKIWVIGASSGIGAALAKSLAQSGAHIAISARSTDKLNDLIQEMGENHVAFSVDVGDPLAVKQTASEVIQHFGSLDSVIFMPALYDPDRVEGMDLDHAHKTLNVNLGGAFNVVFNILPQLKSQGYGQIALCGSVAGYTGLPKAQPYSCTKAAIINFAESLRAEEAKNGLDIKVINPGFVKTQLTSKNDFPMPMALTPEKAAEYLAKGLLKKSFEIHFPKQFTYLVKLIGALPYWLYFPIASKIKS